MGNDLAASAAGEVMEAVLLKGDLSKLTSEERARYYSEVCRSVGLNPLTRPLEYITLNGKLTLYARRDAADQLRKINGISLEVVSRTIEDGLIVVHVRASDKGGRTDEDFGAVNAAGLKGEAAANAILKAITKAKRRVTLSISGMGFLDETEVETVADSKPFKDVTPKAASGFKIAKATEPNALASTPQGGVIDARSQDRSGHTQPQRQDPETGALIDGEPRVPSDATIRADDPFAQADPETGEIADAPTDPDPVKTLYISLIKELHHMAEIRATNAAFKNWAGAHKKEISERLSKDQQETIRIQYDRAKAAAAGTPLDGG